MMAKVELCGACADWKDVGAVAGVIGRCRNAESIYLGYVFAYGRISCSWWKCPRFPAEELFDVSVHADGEVVHKAGPFYVNEDGTDMTEKEIAQLRSASVLEEAAPEMEPAPWQVSGKPARVHMSQVSAEPVPATRGIAEVRGACKALVDLVHKHGLHLWVKEQVSKPATDLLYALCAWDIANSILGLRSLGVDEDEPEADEPAPVVKAPPVFIGPETLSNVVDAGQVLADMIRESGLYLGKGGFGSVAGWLLDALEGWDKATGQYE